LQRLERSVEAVLNIDSSLELVETRPNTISFRTNPISMTVLAPTALSSTRKRWRISAKDRRLRQ
jgi:hypothetical protein